MKTIEELKLEHLNKTLDLIHKALEKKQPISLTKEFRVETIPTSSSKKKPLS
jgi:hypothetical protein